MISPHPPRLRMNRRNTVSVTPAIGASTVAGEILTPPISTDAGTDRVGREFVARTCPEQQSKGPSLAIAADTPAGLSQNFFTALLYPVRQNKAPAAARASL
jgi:hypothetical protein